MYGVMWPGVRKGLAALMLILGADDTAAYAASPRLQVMLQNLGNVPDDVLAGAGPEVARLFALAGVRIVWAQEVPTVLADFRVVVLLPDCEDPAFAAARLGYTPADTGVRGVRGYVFWCHVQATSAKFGAAVDRVLAAAIAHEVGHTLLPEGAHAHGGLMVGPWKGRQVRDASAGRLHFSLQSARLIRRSLSPNAAARSSARRSR